MSEFYLISADNSGSASHVNSEIFDVLRWDHREFRNLCGDLKNIGAENWEEKSEGVRRLRRLFFAHSKAEEIAFYRQVKNRAEAIENDELRAQILSLTDDHQRTNAFLDEVIFEMEKDRGRLRGSKFIPKQENLDLIKKLNALATRILAHIDEEEGEVFSKARKLIRTKEAQEMGRNFMLQKAEFLGVA